MGYVSYSVTAERPAGVGADFDSEAIDGAILVELNAKVGPAVEVHRDGKVFADEDTAARAKQINWNELLAAVDIAQLVADNPPRR